MSRGVYSAALRVAVLGTVIVATAGAQVHPVRWDAQEAEPAASTPSSLVLADGGLEFADGSVQTTAAVSGTARVPRTGQSDVFATGDDGDLQLGVTWPNPRFTDHGNGTVTDNLTGLIWLDDANCFGNQTWANALTEAAALFDGCGDCGGTNGDCGLADSSIGGQWRLPNVRELQSLVHYGVDLPAVPDTSGTGKWSESNPFSGVLSGFYWSSTTASMGSTGAWVLSMVEGVVTLRAKTTAYGVWLVRGGQ